ncbi:MAG: putative DNA binding domain-containing protein, partial [Solirubrobacterales bacterium]|nr:putative DNA binding domain-containing protein [Solirubrobacterales bacterium]
MEVPETNSPYPLLHPERGEIPLTITHEEFRREFPSESQHVEFKRGTSSKPLQETIVAFSNADGGVVLIGVEDDGQLSGRALDSGVADSIHQTVQSVHNPGRYSLHEVQVGQKPVTVISVAKRREGFSQQSNGIVRMRRGTRDEALIGTELRDLLTSRSTTHFESTPTAALVKDADPELLESLKAAFRWSDNDPEKRLQEARYSTSNHLSVAGALYLVEEPHEFLGKSFVEILRFREDDTPDYDLRIEVKGPLPKQLEESSQRVGDLLGSEMVVLGVRRYEIPPVPAVVLREAISNALAHRSYELDRVAVRIELRPSFVRITSPGGLPEP